MDKYEKLTNDLKEAKEEAIKCAETSNDV